MPSNGISQGGCGCTGHTLATANVRNLAEVILRLWFWGWHGSWSTTICCVTLGKSVCFSGYSCSPSSCSLTPGSSAGDQNPEEKSLLSPRSSFRNPRDDLWLVLWVTCPLLGHMPTTGARRNSATWWLEQSSRWPIFSPFCLSVS